MAQIAKVFFTDKRVSLGFRRLSIIDTEGANQPLSNESGSIRLICNGEIYNYKELRKELEAKGHRFYTNGDSETIIHLYEEHGLNMVDYLRGMFAFALYDISKDTVIVSRDPFWNKTVVLLH